MSYATAEPPGATDHAIREVIELAVAVDGLKRGLYRAAQALGVTERWLRGFRHGEPARVSADTFLRATRAREQLRAERRAALLAELRALDAADDAAWQATINHTKARIAALETTDAEIGHSHREVAPRRMDTPSVCRRQEGRGMGAEAASVAGLVTR